MSFTFLNPINQQLAGATIPGSLTVAGLLTTQAGITNSGAQITSSQNINTTGLQPIAASGNLSAALGALDVQSAGNGVKVAEGSNAKQGIATLAAGTVTVANTSVTANSRIFCTTQILGTVTSASTFDTPRVVGTSFTIHASQATDTSTVAWEIFEPG